MRALMKFCRLICLFGSVTQGVCADITLIVSDDGVELIHQYDEIVDAINEARNYPDAVVKTIEFTAGQYFLTKPLCLDERDKNLILTAAPQACVELIGGQQIFGWRPEGKFWVADVPGVKSRQWDFRMLLVNGRYASRARYPEEGRLQHESVFSPRWLSTAAGGWERKPTEVESTTMHYKDLDLDPWLNPDNAEVTVYHMWDETLVGVKAIDRDANVITFLNPAGHPPGGFGIKDYVVWNVRRGMTRPGQWFLDRTHGQVVYWPLPSEKMSDTEIIAPVLETLIRIEGKSSVATDITLRGLVLKGANAPLQTGGFGAKNFDGAISVKNSAQCRFENLEITGVAGWGMRLVGDQFEIKGCQIHHTGAGGINLYSAGALVENNEIHHIGLTYPSAIALCVGSTDPHGDDWALGRGKNQVTIRHNEIHDTPYTGMSCGGSGHVIEYNLIYRTMEELADGSGMYITFCKNLILRNNLVRDIRDAGHSGSSAYYLDELTSGALVENNISMGVSRPVHCHMAENNTFRNNIFIADGSARITLPKCKELVFEKNILIADGPISIVNFDAITRFEDNILFSRTNQVTKVMLKKYKQVGSMSLSEGGSNRQMDPGLLSSVDGNVVFRPGALAGKMGIQPVDGEHAGRYR